MDIQPDPQYRFAMKKSYSEDDWRGLLILAVLQNALDEYLARKISNVLRKNAEQFIFKDNEVFDLAMALIGYEKQEFRNQIKRMRAKSERLRKARNNND